MNFGPDFIPPWRPGLPQVRCARGADCFAEAGPGRGVLVVAVTVDEDGWCAVCAAKVETPTLRLAA